MARCAESLESMLPFSQASVTHRYFFLNTYKHSNQTYCKDESTKRDWNSSFGKREMVYWWRVLYFFIYFSQLRIIVACVSCIRYCSAIFLFIKYASMYRSIRPRSTSYNTCNSTLLQILLALPSPWPDFDVWFAGLVGHHEVEGDVLAVHLLVHPVPAHKYIWVYLMSPT